MATYIFPSKQFDWNFTSFCILSSAAFVLAHLVPYFLDRRGIRSLPGPFFAKFTNLWLSWITIKGYQSDVVHELHKKYGPFVRIAPNRVSICGPEAIQMIYAHGKGALKSDFYDAFVSIDPSVFSTRDRSEHARKRKMTSHIFTQQSIVDFEPNIQEYVGQLSAQWDRLCGLAEKGFCGEEGQGGWKGKDGRLWLDCLPWLHYLSFDIIGDLAFGTPFGMVKAAKDSAPSAVSYVNAMKSYGAQSGISLADTQAIRLLNLRGVYAVVMGTLTPWWRPLLRKLPWFHAGKVSSDQVNGLVVAAVAKRLKAPTERMDFLTKLIEWKDPQGRTMQTKELTSEAGTLLGAGSDTISNTSAVIVYYLALNRRVQAKLQEELDDALGTNENFAAPVKEVKRLAYLDAVISESLRLHAVIGMGLPRVVPADGITVFGQYFSEGTVVSVPTFSLHRDEQLWGGDALEFRPERWIEGDCAELQKSFHPFSFGPRACVGRHLAMMELQIIISSIMRRYDVVLAEPGKPYEVQETFVRRPVAINIGLKRRNCK